MSPVRSLTLVLALGLLPGLPAAADCVAGLTAPDPQSFWDVLESADLDACRRRSVQAQLGSLGPGSGDAPDSDRLIIVWQALVDQWDGAAPAAPAPLSELYAALGQRAAAAVQFLRQRGSAGQDFALPSVWAIDFNGNLGAVAGADEQLLAPAIPVRRLLTGACAAEGDACPQAFADGDAVLEHILLANGIGARLGQPTVSGLLDKVAEVNADWDRFLFDSKAMYPWSLWLTDVVNRRRNDYAHRHGLLEPPDTQYFLLHPAPGFGFVHAADDGDQLAPTVYVELLGFNRWRARYLTGVSAIVEYADRAGVEDVSYGALFTFANRYSVGVTAGGGEVGVTLGLDLANLYRDRLQPQIRRIRAGAR